MTSPTVAPFESCITCMRGDTATALVVRGEPEFYMAFLEVKLGLAPEEAIGTVVKFAELELGCEPGMVPDGIHDFGVRLCTDCAAKADLQVGPLAAGELPGYAQEAPAP